MALSGINLLFSRKPHERIAGVNMGISALWAKKSTNGAYWLPLDTHLRDTAEIAKKLWRRWLPENVRRIITI